MSLIDKTQPLGLPQGSVRAILAIMGALTTNVAFLCGMINVAETVSALAVIYAFYFKK